MADEILSLVASIESRLKGSAPADPKEFAGLIWDLLKMQIYRVTEGARNNKLYTPHATRDFEVINKLSELYHRIIGAPVTAPGSNDKLSDGMNEAVRVLSKGDPVALKAYIEAQEKKLKDQRDKAS